MTTDEAKKATIERCARLAHEANRLWCLLLGDESQGTWEHAEPWQKDSALKGVVAVLEGKTPRQLHESWMAEKIAHGWVWGEKKDVSAKTHPCLKEYSRLPPEQKAKDHIFYLAVKVADAGPLSAWGKRYRRTAIQSGLGGSSGRAVQGGADPGVRQAVWVKPYAAQRQRMGASDSDQGR